MKLNRLIPAVLVYLAITAISVATAYSGGLHWGELNFGGAMMFSQIAACICATAIYQCLDTTPKDK